jgi:DNA-binding transcriptional MerR regulator
MLRIGEFARLGGVSIKTLRYYDEIGLLKPSHVDPTSGYRYYGLGQLDRLHRIVALRELGFGLAQVARVLDERYSPGQARALLEELRGEVERRIAEDRARLAMIDVSLGVGIAPGRQPMVRRAAPEIVATVRAAASDVETIFEQVETEVARYGARAARPPMLICHEAGLVDVAVPVTAPLPGSRIATQALPAVPVAMSLVHIGGYEGLVPVSDTLFGHLGERGLRPSGPLRVLYHRFGASCDGYTLDRASLAAHSGEYVTELVVPVHSPSI